MYTSLNHIQLVNQPETPASWGDSLLSIFSKTLLKLNAMKTIAMIVLCLLTFTSFSQEKQIDRNAMQQQLTEVNAEIQDLSEKITMIKNRMEALPENEEVHPEILEGYRQLNAKKEKLERVAYSINHALNNDLKKVENEGK